MITLIVSLLAMLIALGSMIVARNCLHQTRRLLRSRRLLGSDAPCHSIAYTDQRGDAPIRCALGQGHTGPHLILPGDLASAGFTRPPF